jgi:phosphoglycerol transferase MdoB-like AlkP superfamily enzyme
MTGKRFGVPQRYSIVVLAAVIFIAISTLLRLGLFGYEVATDEGSRNVAGILAVGLIYDLAATSFVLIPFAVLALIVPNNRIGRKIHGVLASMTIVELLFGTLFMSIAEILFWNEFASRFNFIAVDYLVYTRETIGNVLESYSVGWLMAGLIAVTGLVTYAIRRPVWHAATADGGTWRQRLAVSAVLLALPAISFFLIGDAPRDMLSSTIARELASNGGYEFCRAFRANELNYDRYYARIDRAQAASIMRGEFANATFTNGADPLERDVKAEGPPKPLNLVVVTMESFGAELTEHLGGQIGLSPNLDRLADQGLKFTRMYATGTRTVRGLEAITLSIPPTPGQAVLKRKNNKGYQTLGGVLKENGWEPIFFYGGYGYFDNMNDFFGGNGYEVVDRLSVDKKDVSHETIWGIADEDLFKKVISVIDERVAKGRRVFAHVMTTSNHRPYTYPNGRIAIPSGSGREGAAAYSDWAIGDFVRRAASHPWFKDTVFVFIADHTSNGRGKTDLPMPNYHIPMIVYSPTHIQPRVIDALSSQIDVGPTLLGLLNISYRSTFFGQDVLAEDPQVGRALMSNYLTVGLANDDVQVELSPKRTERVFARKSGQALAANDPRRETALDRAIAYFQLASDVLKAHKPRRSARR